MFDEADLIHAYSRAEALADGTLIDVSETAGEAGFRVPVALTRTAWFDCVAWGPDDSARVVHQDQSGRLWDVLWMARLAARGKQGVSQLSFSMLRVARDSTDGRPTAVTLLMDIGPGDEGEPVITIGFAEDF